MSTSQTIGQSSRSPSTIRELGLSDTLESNDPENYQRDRDVERRAAQTLGRHPHFFGQPETVQFRCDDKHLTLCGCLPSYYLKQLAQEGVRKIADSAAVEIVNEINVLSPIREVGPAESIDTVKPADLSNVRKPR